MKKTFFTNAIPALLSLCVCGLPALTAKATSPQYQFYYNVGSQSLSADPTVSFTTIDNYVTSTGQQKNVDVAIKEIPVSVNNGYIYWNVGRLNNAGTYDMILDSPKNISFSSKKTNVSWLRVVLDENGLYDNKAVSSAGFRISTADGTQKMSLLENYSQSADVTFSGTDKTFCIHYGSVNSESDLGTLTADISVSDNCLEATVVYNFLTNGVTVTETKWGDPIVAPGINPTAAESAKCFIDNPEARTITFIMDNNLWKVQGITRMEVRCSFTGWASSSQCQMSHDTNRDIWYVTLPYSEVNIPGNSGQPEFKFVSNGGNYLGGDGRSFIPEGYVFLNSDKNNIVVFSTDDFETIKSNSKEANIIKKLSAFDLTTEAGQEEISNFRLVPGTKHLYRSYHPYKITKSDNSTEPYRMKYVAELATQHGITCDICLSENEENNLKSFNIAGTNYTEKIPAYYQQIISNKRVLYVGAGNSVPTYNVVYYTPESDKFGTWVKEIVEFIADENNPGPFEIHCRIGTDRTGAFSGLLAAICGATWQQIATDYQLTNRMGIQEFRDYHLLQYSFQRLLSTDDINTVDNLQEAMSNYLVNKGYVTAEQLATVRKKLGADDSSAGVENVAQNDCSDEQRLYNLQGILTGYTTENAPAGIYILVKGNSSRKIVL